MKNLPEDVLDEPDSYFLEPITEEGSAIPVKQAIKTFMGRAKAAG